MSEQKQFDKNRSTARGLGAAVYIGAVIAATMLFISFILLAFPADAYFSRVIMTVAGLMVGGSMLAFPFALHNWAITGEHRKWTTILYYVEMLIIGVNTIVSFVSLLAKYTGYDAPDWVVLYEPFSIASIVYTVFAWGTVFLLDPAHKLQAAEHDADARFAEKISAKREEFIDSVQGEDLVIEITRADVMERYNPARYKKDRKQFGTGGKEENAAIPAPELFTKKEALTSTVEMACMECGKQSVDSIYCSDACELAATERHAKVSANRAAELRKRTEAPTLGGEFREGKG